MDRLDMLLEAVKLKALPRAGWVRKGVPAPETVASHSWGVAWLVLAVAPEGIDLAKALAYATLHDLAEVRVGDLTPVDPVSREEKSRREHEAISEMTRALGRPQLAALWDAFENGADPEARLVRELDKLDMAIQALAHHEAGRPGMREFFASADRAITDPALRPWMEAIGRRMV
ncbi:MAG: HD domain-containing protein [Myxococcales bacterium]